MNKNTNKKVFGCRKVFDNIRIGKKDTGIKKRLNSGNLTIRKSNKLMKGVSYGNDLNFQRYMLYLDKLHEEEELNLKNENLKEKKIKDLNELNKNNILSKKISFTDFENKFKINPYLLQYFDYYDIQKINRIEVERNLKNENKSTIKLENTNSDDSEEEKIDFNSNTNIKNKINHNKTENNLDVKNNKYEHLINNLICNTFVKQKSLNNKPHKFKKLHLSGVDFNLINKISSEALKVKKKLARLKYYKELKKERDRIHKKINKAMLNSNGNNKYFNYNMNNILDEYTIYHSVESKNIRKLNKLKLDLDKKLEENIPKNKKLSKTIYQNSPTYFIYIPNSAKYKHISYHKDCLFNKEYNYTKKSKSKNKISLKKYKRKKSIDFNDINNISKISYLLKNQKNNLFTNSNAYFLVSDNNLLTKSNKIINNLKEIKSLLKTDRNYTSKTINRASKKYQENERTKQDQKLLENIMRDDRKNIRKMKEIQKKRKNRRINENNNVFCTLKQMNECYEKDKRTYSEMNNQFSKSLNALCKNERKQNRVYKKILKNNYHLKLENDESDKDIKIVKENIDKGQDLLIYLNTKIKKKYYEINDIIDESCKKNKKGVF